MARVQLELPDAFIYTTDLEVRVSDLNYGGHTGNDRILTLMQEARVHLYRHWGFESEIRLEGDVGQIISDAVVVYKSESFLGDVLQIQIGVTDFNKYGFDLVYLVANKKSGKEVARGKTGIVCFDYKKRKVAPVPGMLLKKLTAAN